ncbi:hypothetical protein [Pseudoxanthomonas sp. PXM04]|uniref:hypothetical protein n=1 Tax=Pseudoxanthomonas sp. PXM04 TaxID=2769297 RepID=UPI00178148C3|nr:hypothetical protein [Pseudoxanthomonas sp. PXM04]MBD9376201.1 hypothetical protein [Pseudoxanthomonas sp. PXM04]
MARRILLLEVAPSSLPATTPAAPVYGSWVPSTWQSPPPPVPLGLAASPQIGGIRLTWLSVTTKGVQYELERAVDNAGVPGASASVYTGTDRVYNASESTTTHWRVRAVLRGIASAWSPWVMQTPVAPADLYGGGSGYNLLGDEYARYKATQQLTAATFPPVASAPGGLVYAVADSGAIAGRSLKVTTTDTNANNNFAYFGTSGTDYNTPLAPGRYLVSFYGRASVAGHQVRMTLKDADGNIRAASTLALTTSRARYSASIDMTSAVADGAVLLFYFNRSGVAGRDVYIDGLMIEPQIGSSLTPSPFVPGQSTQQADRAVDIATAAAADATASLAQLSDIANDGKLTANEKVTAKREYEEVTTEQVGIDAQGTAYGLAAEKAAYDNAVTALKTYLRTTVGVLDASYAWTNVTGTTNIVRGTWNNTWTALYNARQSLLNAIAGKARALAAVMAAGANLIPNPTFTSNVTGTPVGVLGTNAECTDNWIVVRGEESYPATAVNRLSSGAIRCEVGNNPIVNTAIVAPQVRTIQPIPVEAGATYVLVPEIDVAYNGSNPSAGITVQSRIFVYFYEADGTRIEPPFQWTRNRAAAMSAPVTLVAPAGARFAHIYFDTYVRNQSGATYTHNNTVILRTDFKSVSLIRAYSLDTDLTDGAQYVRYGIEDAYYSGGKWRNGMRINGSGQQAGGAYNFPPGGFANMGAMWLTGATITYTATAGSPASATISVSAMTLRSMGSDKAYSASSGSVTGTGGTTVKYHLYYDDDTWAGGSRTLGITTDLNQTQNSRSRLYVGSLSVTFPTSGSGGGGGGPPCVVEESHLPCGRRAGEVRRHSLMHLINPFTFERRTGRVSQAERKRTDCVRVQLANGVWLDCSTSAPLPTRERGLMLAPDVLGHHLPSARLRWRWLTLLPAGWMVRHRWLWIDEFSRVVGVTHVGAKVVIHITVENACFLAGGRRGAYMAHHNIKMDPGL